MEREGEWVAARELAVGDRLRRRGGRLREVHELTTVAQPLTVFDLSVEHPHDFFANGVLVHNKTAPQPGPKDGWAYVFDRPPSEGWSTRKWWGP